MTQRRKSAFSLACKMNSRDDPPNKRQKLHDDCYFKSYAHLGIHEEMLRDRQRTCAYQESILSNLEDFKDKVVLDLGAGTCILSMFCAKAGAKKVYAVEASDIADLGKLVVEKNNLSDKIEIIKSKIEDINLPEKVDVIISEWMGYFLLYESMFESVIFARNKFLKEGGKMYPSTAKMYIAPMSDEAYVEEKINFWKDVYGFDYTCIMDKALEMNFEEPQTETVLPENVLSFPVLIKEIDCTTVQSWDQLKDFTAPFSCKSIVSADFHGFVGWFDVFLGSKNSVCLSTAPEAGYTHWRQTLFLFTKPIEVKQDDVIEGTIHIKADEVNKRFFLVEFDCKVRDIPVEKKFQLQ